MGFKEFVAIITLVPALAWFVTAGVKIYKLYQVKEDEIKKVAAEKKEELRDTAEKITSKVEEMTEQAEKISRHVTEEAKDLKQKVEEKIHPTQAPTETQTPAPNDDESQPTAEGGGE